MQMMDNRKDFFIVLSPFSYRFLLLCLVVGRAILLASWIQQLINPAQHLAQIGWLGGLHTPFDVNVIGKSGHFWVMRRVVVTEDQRSISALVVMRYEIFSMLLPRLMTFSSKVRIEPS